MRARISLVLSIVVLTACATPAEQAAQAERDAERMMSIYGPACSRLGYKPDSDQWRDCVMRLNARDEVARYSYPYPYYPYGPYYPGWYRRY